MTRYIDNELSNALVVGLGYGVAPFPVRNAGKIIDIYGQQRGIGLFEDMCRLTDEAAQIPIDWTSTSLVDAGRMIHTEMHRRYPALSDKALDAIVWKFTYDWR